MPFTCILLAAISGIATQPPLLGDNFVARDGITFEKSAEGKVIGIRADSERFSDIDMRKLPKYPGLETLIVNGSKITDDGMSSLTHLRNLKYLVLKNNTELKGHGFKHLANCKNLETLVVPGCPITDEGLKRLPKLDKVVSLNLSRSRISDDGLAEIKRLPSLESLWLSKTSITTSGIKKFEGVAKLKALFLSDTAFDDEGVEFVTAKAKGLEWLNIAGTKVTDNCIPHIIAVRNLKILDVRRTLITKAGVDRIRKAFPKASVEAD